jgi:CcmD family protein
MGAWGFVFLAYGIVWGAILIYWLMLKRRLRRAEMELARLQRAEETQKNAQT